MGSGLPDQIGLVVEVDRAGRYLRAAARREAGAEPEPSRCSEKAMPGHSAESIAGVDRSGPVIRRVSLLRPWTVIGVAPG